MSRYRPESKITTLIIHCAATPNGGWFDAKDIDDWHSERNFKRNPKLIGFQQPRLKHIGYHFVIGLKGAVESGRATTETGAHARGYNGVSLGTCMIGTDKFTPEQWLSLKQHVQALQNRFPDLSIIGHRQVNKHKSCPGFDVQDWLANDMNPPKQHIYPSIQ
jgi:hypothetical protein